MMASEPDVDGPGRVDWLSPRSQGHIDQRLIRPSRMNRVLKIALPVAALALMAMLLLWPHFDTRYDGPDLTFPKGEIAENRLRMSKLRFQGLDKQGRPYVLTAETAVQTRDVPREVTLDGPMAEIRADNGWYIGKAKSGFYKETEKQLSLDGEVQLFTSNGYEIHGQQAMVDLKEGTILSDTRVTGQGPVGVISGNALAIGRKEKLVYLYKGVTATLYPRQEGG